VNVTAEAVVVTREEARERFGPEAVQEWPGGGFIVAGEYYEPLCREECVLVEYASAEVMSAPDAATRLVAWARQTTPRARRLILRVSPLEFELPGFDDYLYYMTLERDPRTTEDTSDIAVRSSGPADKELVGHWLVQAFDDALGMRQEEASEGAAADQSTAVLDSPEALSFVAGHNGQDIGHVTLLLDQVDDLTGLPYVELLDVLVEREHPRRHAAEAALVQRSWEVAQTQGKPLVGHIVVREKASRGAGYEHDILNRLYPRGWAYAHKFMITPLEG
jgi:hypothetical protein